MTDDMHGPYGRQGGEQAEAIHHTPRRLWVVTWLIIVGFALVAIGFILPKVWLMVLGAVVVVICSGLAMLWGIMENVH